MDDERVRIVDVCQNGNIPRNTLTLILNGTTTEPHIRTLRAIAIGLASHPRKRTTDYQKAAAIEAALGVAAGYRVDDGDERPDAALPLALVPIFADPEKAKSWVHFITKRAHLSSLDLKRLDAITPRNLVDDPPET